MRWRTIKGYEGLYMVSDAGDVMSIGRPGTDGRMVKQNTSKEGYPTVCLCKLGIKKTMYVHRLVAESFIENRHKKPMVNHRDLNKTNNHCMNLEWVTAKENTRHANENGANGSSKKRRSADWLAKVSKKQVLEIFLLKGKMSGTKVAAQYGISDTCVYDIWNGNRWGWLTSSCTELHELGQNVDDYLMGILQ